MSRKCTHCGGDIIEKINLVYCVPAREDGDSWEGWGLTDAMMSLCYQESEHVEYFCEECGSSWL